MSNLIPDDAICSWCGRQYSKHDSEFDKSGARPRVPCGLLKLGFLPKNMILPRPIPKIEKTEVKRIYWEEDTSRGDERMIFELADGRTIEHVSYCARPGDADVVLTDSFFQIQEGGKEDEIKI